MPTIHNPNITTHHFSVAGKRRMLPGKGRIELTDAELAQLLEEPAWQRRLEKTEHGYRVRTHRGVARVFQEELLRVREERQRAETERRTATDQRLEAIETELAAQKREQEPAAPAKASGSKKSSKAKG